MKGILVGVGGRGRHWIKVCRDFGGVELLAFVEPSAENRQRASSEFSIAADKFHNSLGDALKTQKADFVLDVTPPAAHEQIALAAFGAGLHVLGEKPISSSIAAAQRMIDASRKAKRRHMITQNYRFGASCRTVKRLVSSDVVGKPGQLDIVFYMPWADIPGSHYVTEPYMFLNDMCIHHFDMLRCVLGIDPVSVQCTTWNQPWGWHKGDACHLALFKFDNGLVATHQAIGCSLGKKTTWNGDWRVEGPRGSLQWQNEKIFVTHDHRTDTKRSEEIPLDTPKFTGEKAILSEFISAVKEDRDPECSGADNLKSLSMALAAVKSAQEKREVKLSEAK